MTQINAFKCDSCQTQEEAHWNGEHFLPPAGWVEINEGITLQKIGHLCIVCRDTAFGLNLRNTKTGKKIARSLQ